VLAPFRLIMDAWAMPQFRAMTARAFARNSQHIADAYQLEIAIKLALPPAAAVLMLTVRSITNRVRS
jgi:hypothetical protein